MHSKTPGINKSKNTLNPRWNISNEEWEEIENSLAGKLTKEQSEKFNKRLSEEPQLSEKVSHIRLIMLGVRETAFQSDLRNISLTGKNTSTKKNAGGRRLFMGWMYGAAAAIIVVVILFFSGVFKNSDSRLYSKFYHPDSGLISSMGVSDQYPFDVAMIDYKSGKYSVALEKLQQLRKSHPQNDTLNYFIGNSYLALGKTEEAIPYLNEVADHPASVFAKDAEWYLGLAFLKLGNNDQAFKHISRSENERKNELLKQISK